MSARVHMCVHVCGRVGAGKGKGGGHGVDCAAVAGVLLLLLSLKKDRTRAHQGEEGGRKQVSPSHTGPTHPPTNPNCPARGLCVCAVR